MKIEQNGRLVNSVIDELQVGDLVRVIKAYVIEDGERYDRPECMGKLGVVCDVDDDWQFPIQVDFISGKNKGKLSRNLWKIDNFALVEQVEEIDE